MSAATVFDSTLFGNIFGTEEARQAFSERSYVANLIKAECALAEAEEAEGIVPGGTAAVLREHCNVSQIDWQLLAARTEIVGYPVLPLVEQMSKWVPEETCKSWLPIRQVVLQLAKPSTSSWLHSLGCHNARHHGPSVGTPNENWS